jgi:hypothetical protein
MDFNKETNLDTQMISLGMVADAINEEITRTKKPDGEYGISFGVYCLFCETISKTIKGWGSKGDPELENTANDFIKRSLGMSKQQAGAKIRELIFKALGTGDIDPKTISDALKKIKESKDEPDIGGRFGENRL